MEKWITFDLDGTLMQNPFVEYVFPEIVRLVKKQDGTIENVLEDIIDEHMNRMKDSRFVEAYDWDGIVSVYLSGKGLSPIHVENVVCQFCSEPAIHLLEEEVLEVLEGLKAKGYFLAAVTNGYLKYQLPVMDALKLTPLFDAFITPEFAGFAKPDYRIFESVKGNIAFHVGDRVEHDIKSAKEAGISTVLINRSMPKEISLLPISGRIGHSKCKQILLEKLNKETKKGYTELPDWAIPDYVICSITELLAIC